MKIYSTACHINANEELMIGIIILPMSSKDSQKNLKFFFFEKLTIFLHSMYCCHILPPKYDVILHSAKEIEYKKPKSFSLNRKESQITNRNHFQILLYSTCAFSASLVNTTISTIKRQSLARQRKICPLYSFGHFPFRLHRRCWRPRIFPRQIPALTLQQKR